MKYFTAPAGYGSDDRNPFTHDGRCGPDWTAFFLLDRDDESSCMGTGKNGLFAYQFGRRARDIKGKLADFLRYESAHNRNVIISFPDGIDVDAFVADALATTPEPHVVRETDPRYAVHSTHAGAAKHIGRDAELKSLAKLRREGVAGGGVGFDSLGEPPEYADYICLGDLKSTGPEVVTASNATGRFMGDDEPYEPGVRFYFDVHRIIRTGLDTRVVGAIKVLDRLPLDPFLVASIGPNDVAPERRRML